jgi:hypothetical protein
MSTTQTTQPDLVAVKHRQQKMWASGDYSAVAARGGVAHPLWTDTTVGTGSDQDVATTQVGGADLRVDADLLHQAARRAALPHGRPRIDAFDAGGRVIFDSENPDNLGADYSQWRDRCRDERLRNTEKVVR